MDGAGTAKARDRNDGATSTRQDAVDDNGGVLTLIKLDEIENEDKSSGHFLTWSTNGDTAEWGIVWL